MQVAILRGVLEDRNSGVQVRLVPARLRSATAKLYEIQFSDYSSEACAVKGSKPTSDGPWSMPRSTSRAAALSSSTSSCRAAARA